MNEMRLYVWDEFCPDYTDGLAFSIADTERHAREMIADRMGYVPANWGECKTYSLSIPIAFAVAGGG